MWNFLRYLMGPEATMATMGDGRPDNSLSDIQSLTKAYSEARAKRIASQSGGLTSPPAVDVPSPPISGLTPGYRDQDVTPMANPANWGVQGFPSAAPASSGWQDSTQYPPSAPAAAPAPTPAPAVSQTPLPQARPAEAPQAQPDTSFFMRNALMMRDPAGGGFIDPQGAASVRGPDLINKMMTYLHNKDMG